MRATPLSRSIHGHSGKNSIRFVTLQQCHIFPIDAAAPLVEQFQLPAREPGGPCPRPRQDARRFTPRYGTFPSDGRDTACLRGVGTMSFR